MSGVNGPLSEPDSLPAVTWASAFIEHTVRRTIFMLGQRFHESEFEQKCQLVLETLTAWQQEHGEEWMPSRNIACKHRWPAAAGWHCHEDCGKI